MTDLLRRGQVYVLWNTTLEWLPTPRTTLDTSKAPQAGFVTGKRVRCLRCRATGRVRGDGSAAGACGQCTSSMLNHLKLEAEDPTLDPWHPSQAATLHACRPCLLCDGTGWRLARRGEPGEDMYRKAQSNDRDESFHSRVDGKRQRDNEIAHLDRLVEIAEGREEPHWWLSYAADQKQSLYERGHYRDLDIAMTVLRDTFPLRHELVMRVEVYREPFHIDQRVRGLIDVTADWVAARMPDPILVPAEYAIPDANQAAKDSLWRGRTDRHEQARERRRDRVLRAHFDWEWSAEQIAQHESLSARRVRQILAEHRGDAGQAAAVATGPAA